MNKQHKYSMKELMEEHEEYEFSIIFSKEKNAIETRARIPADILASGLSLALADMPISTNDLMIYIDDIKDLIKTIRKEYE